MMTPDAQADLRAHEVVARLGAKRRATADAGAGAAMAPAVAAPSRPSFQPTDIAPALLARLLGQADAADRMAYLRPMAPPSFAPVGCRVDAADVAPERTWEVADDLRSALATAVPQALLRDLHRPVRQVEIAFEVDEALREALRPSEFTAASIMATNWRAAPTPSPWQLPADIAAIRQWFAGADWATLGKDRP